MVLKAIDYKPASNGEKPSLQILDQLQLPHTTLYIPIRNCRDGFDAIRDMKVRGAPAIAIVAALSLAVELDIEVLPTDPHAVCQTIVDKLLYLKTSRPTAVNLGDAVAKLTRSVREAVAEPVTTTDSIVERYVKAAELMLVHDVEDNKAIGAHGARWIVQNTQAGQSRKSDRNHALNILTICNTGSLATAGYGTALGVVRSLHENRNLTQAYACETRPYNQGSRLTAYELVHDQIPATLITDSMAASLMAREGPNIAAVVVGADRVAANGDTANKIGTYSLAVLARHHGIKFLVAAPRTTIDRDTSSGREIVIEQRAAGEVTCVRGPQILPDGTHGPAATISIAAEGIDVWNPAFDVTPHELIDGVVTEMGVVEKQGECFDFEPIFAALTESDIATRASTIGGM